MTLINIQQLAKQLDVSVTTIYKWTEEQKVPHIKLPNGRLRFDQTKIDQWLKQRSISTNIAGIAI